MNAFGSAMAVDPRVYDGQSAAANDTRRTLGFALTLEGRAVLARHHRVELARRFVPLIEQIFGARASSVARVLLHEMTQCFISEEHTSELQSRRDLVCRLLLEKKNG